MPLDRVKAYLGAEQDMAAERGSLWEECLLLGGKWEVECLPLEGKWEAESHHLQWGRQGGGCLLLGGKWEARSHQALAGRVRVGCKWQGKMCSHPAVRGHSLGCTCIQVACCSAVHPVWLSG